VIDVALLSVIRRWYLRDGLTIREIARRTGLSRNTVRKYLRSGLVEPRYPERQSPSQLDAYVPKLELWLKTEASKPRKLRRNLKQIHADLMVLGYSGSYDRVAAFARQWRQAQQERARSVGRGTFIPLTFAPGEAFQFDWSEEWVVIAGERTKLQVAQVKLAYSRAFFLRAYRLQTHEMLFDAHYHAFRVLGGIPRRGIYDNMKTAVDRVGKGKIRDINQRFQAMASHYLFEPGFCNPAAGWEKGQIEKTVQDSRHRLWQQAPAFKTLTEVNDWLEQRCPALWQEIRHPELAISVAEVWATERPSLMPIPSAFDGFVEHTKRVSPTCLITFECNRYSVPASYANRPVSLRVYPDQLVVAAEGQVIAEHARIIQRQHKAGKTVYDWRHYLAVLQRKPGALRNGAPFTELPEAFKQLQTVLLRRPGGDREMVDILALVLHHDENAVLVAVEMALEAGNPSKPHILNLLGRLLEIPRPAPVRPPEGLELTLEPEANVSRYDRLREATHAA
jgi:transposase